jgi:cytochrome c oxidase subunit 2
MFQNHLGLPINASAQGGPIDQLISYLHVLMFVLFIGWSLFFVYILWRFRKGRNPRADHDGVKSHTSSYIEAGVAVIEIALLVGLSIPFWSKKVSAFPTSPDTVHVRVIAQQFAWNIHYPGPDGKFGRTEIKLVSEDNPIGLDRKDPAAKDDVVTLNQLHLPVNRPVILDLTTKDVIHSFFLPLFRVKQDTIPGMSIPIYFTPTQTTDQIREQMRQTISLPSKRTLELYVPMEDYKDKDGTILAAKGKPLSKTKVEKLQQHGITTLDVAPANPTEIACAQLCGINHYRMKGYVTVETPAEFEKWYADQVESAKEE